MPRRKRTDKERISALESIVFEIASVFASMSEFEVGEWRLSELTEKLKGLRTSTFAEEKGGGE